jgi:hypothetical protein
VEEGPDLLVEWALESPNRRALVLGAGGGAEAMWLAQAGFEVVAVEKDPLRAAELEHLGAGKRIRVHPVDATMFTIEPDHYGLVVALAVLHFIAPRELPGLAGRITTGLMAKGRLIAQVLVDAADGKDEQPVGEGVHWFGRGELRRLFAGLEPLHEETYRFVDPRRRPGFATGASLVARKPNRDRG